MMDTSDKHIPVILGALCVAFLPNVTRLPAWIVAWCILCWSYSFLAVTRNWPWPGKITRHILAIGGFTIGLFTFGHSMGREAGVGLLSLMVGLKPLEIRSHRDRMMTIFLAYFLVIANLFFTKALTMTIYMFLSVLTTTAVLVRIHYPEGRFAEQLRLSARIIFMSVPIMIVLFYLFPRLPGSLWGLPKLTTGRTGLSDVMTPGSISELVKSDEIAFRAEFQGEIPKAEQLYWRGVVFSYFSGRSWRPGLQAPRRKKILSGGDPVQYTVILEPHEKKWLFALDLPAWTNVFGKIYDDHTLKTRRNVRDRVRYVVNSYTTYHTGPLKQWEFAALSLPNYGNPKARLLAQQWVETFETPEGVASAALRFFSENDFAYTLNPPLLGSDTVDDFLFRTRKGYCEHYASAFAFLMRAASIPARIVGGYLGGERNPFGNYLIVRQSEAHAWVEIWLPKKGWQRIDPTSAVAPERVAQGMEAALSPEEISSLYALPYLRPFTKYIKKITLGWDAVNNLWNQHVMGYSFFSQQRFLSKIGLKSGAWRAPAKALLLAFGVVSGLVLLIAVFIFKQPFKDKDIVLETYNRFCEKMARLGFPRKPEQGPVDYARLLSESRNDLADEIRTIIGLYVRLRYGRGGDKPAEKEFRRRVKRFAPQKQILR
jgi:protein-glutamine gamma-glutamyltransferase